MEFVTRLPSPSGNGRDDAKEQLSRQVWDKCSQTGYAKVISKHAVIPNGLSQPMRGMTSTSGLRWEVSGWLAKPAGCRLLAELFSQDSLPAWKSMDSTWCCSESIARQLNKRLDRKLEPLDLPRLIKMGVAADGVITPHFAEVVAKHLLFNADGERLDIVSVLDPN